MTDPAELVPARKARRKRPPAQPKSPVERASRPASIPNLAHVPARRAAGRQRFWVRIDHEAGPDELLRAFVAQFYRLDRSQDVERVLQSWHWIGVPRRVVGADAGRGGLWLTVDDPTDSQVAGMSDTDRAHLNTEVDRRFAEQTGLPASTRLGTGPRDADLRSVWRGIRANLLAEQSQQRELLALPEDVRRILFAGGRRLDPDEYARALGLGHRLEQLSPADRARYLATVNDTSTDLNALETSIAGFELQQRLLAGADEAFDDAAVPLFGLEELYSAWRDVRQAEDIVAIGAAGYEAQDRAITAARRRFDAALMASPFATEGDFLAAVERFRLRFRTQAVNVALGVIAGYEHLLHVALLKFRDTDAAQQLVARIAASGAPADFAAARSADSAASAARELVSDGLGHVWVDSVASVSLRGQARALRQGASAKVVTASGAEPIIDPAVLGAKTDREALAGATADLARSQLLEVVAGRMQDAARVRAELREDPERVFSIAGLMAATREQYGVTEGSVYSQIIDDHIEQIKSDHLFSTITLTILALILGALVPVGGWVAAAALVTGAGISTLQAVDAIEEYGRGESEYALGFIAEEPSLFWVGVAVVGAAFELGLTAGQLLKASAPALSRLRGPLTELAAADAETAAAKLRTLTEQIDAAEGLQARLKAALKARAAAQVELKRALGGSLYTGITGVEPVLVALYRSVRSGISSVTALRRERQVMAALTELTGAEGRSLPELAEAFTRVKEVVRAGDAAGMDEATILRFVERLEDVENAAGLQNLTRQMRAWRPPTELQLKAEAALTSAHGDLAMLRARRLQVESELAARRLGKRPSDRVAMDELSAELARLTGGPGKGIGTIGEAQLRFEAAMAAAAKVRIGPLKLMRRAFDASTVGPTVLRDAGNVDRVGGLLTPAAGVHPDHIVSLSRIENMAGVSKLRLDELEELATRADNLVAMDAAANLSKGARSWSTWRQARHFYPEETIASMRRLEEQRYTQIQQWILVRTAGR